MTTSGTTSFTLTAAQVIQYAGRKMGVIRAGGTLNANEVDDFRVELEVMMKEWALTGPYITTTDHGSLALTAATASYDLITTPKPLRIVHARYKQASGIEIPMSPLTRDEYFSLPQKDSYGPPLQYFFDPQSSALTLYVWPVLSTVTTEAIEYTYQRRIEDIGAVTNHIDIPQEWLSTAGYALATRMCDDYGIADEVAGRIRERAQSLLAAARDFDREQLVTFVPGR